MLRIAMLWFLLDIISVAMVLYDCHRWYGNVHDILFPPVDTGEEEQCEIAHGTASLVAIPLPSRSTSVLAPSETMSAFGDARQFTTP
jgi:hypothetical protein